MIHDRESSEELSENDRRARLARMMEGNRQGLGMRVLAVMVEHYGVLRKELWDLNSESDAGAGRKISFNERIPEAVFESIITSARYRIADLTLDHDLRDFRPLPSTLRRLHVIGPPFQDLSPLPTHLVELEIEAECYITQPLVFPSTLQKLVLEGCVSDHPLSLPDGLLQVHIHDHYTHPITLPAGLQELVFGYSSHFNHPITLPETIKTVRLGYAYDHPLVLPPGVKEVEIGKGFSHDLSLPDSITKLSWNCNRPVELPLNLLEVTFSYDFNQPVVFPPSLKKVVFHGNGSVYSHPITFPLGVEELDWRRSAAGMTLPQSLRKLKWSSELDTVQLPPGLREIELLTKAHIVLNEGLVKVTFCQWRPIHVDLPASVEQLAWAPGNTFTHPSVLPQLSVENFCGPDEDLDLSQLDNIHKVTVDTRYSRNVAIKALPSTLKVLEFITRSPISKYGHGIIGAVPVPKGCKVIGGKGVELAFE